MDVFDYNNETGDISSARILCSFPQEWGFPDGCTIDADGHLWVAFWGSATVRCIELPSATVTHVVHTRSKYTTACAFGGPELDVLFITSAKEDDPAEEAGALFEVRIPGVRGLPAPEYCG